ncbi:MAG: FAD-linked oxidase C-terminal domain-containing protein [Thermodesulfovibrionia bacterium]|nr:FAD-linked oxidase C-terminal domain-containing protein [Thermodesulfovibrionia bacterium]
MKDLKDILPGRVSTEAEELFCYGFDASKEEGLPSAVVRPLNTEEVSKAARYAFENNISIVPRGAGSGMTGGSVPLNDSMVISLEGMNRIIDIDERNMVVTLEPGVINKHLQDKLEPLGLFYPPDPTSMNFCTIGGNVAENAGGPRAVKYGVTRDYVLGLEVVLSDGKVITTGVKTHKGVVGYDLSWLIVGSEGTLCTVTKIFLKVLPLPEEVITMLCSFSSLEKASEAVPMIVSSGTIPRTLEFMDSGAIQAVESYRPVGLPGNSEALLLIEVDGSSDLVRKDADKIASICANMGADVSIADGAYARERLWESRKALSPALYHLKPDKINEDIVVPRTKIPQIIRSIKLIEEKYNLMIVNFGHAGDGNIHVNIMTDRDNKEEYQMAQRAVKDIFEETLKLGGTISGEHGVGITKSKYLRMELSDASIGLMRSIKDVFDPRGIMNPGKIFPSA